MDMTLKEMRKKYQGKYYKFGRYYFKFIRIFQEEGEVKYCINVECIDTWLNDIQDNITLFYYNEKDFNAGYDKITKREYVEEYKKAQENMKYRCYATITGYNINTESCRKFDSAL